MSVSDYKKRVLIAVSGMSPQILTETLYGLVTREVDQFIPTDIHLITTQSGADRAELTLLKKTETSGWFYRLCEELNLPEINFSTDNIHVVTDKQGKPLEDLKTVDDNEAAANFITNFVRQQCQDDEAALHVSIAGGRKTMGFYVGYALSLFGRKQDKLSHVLVSEKFENLTDFFYPSASSPVIYSRDNKEPLNPMDAKISLADIPVVMFNYGANDLIKGYDFRTIIEATQKQQEPVYLCLDANQRTINANGEILKPTDKLFAFYWWVVTMHQGGEVIVNTKKKTPEAYRYSAGFLKIYEQLKDKKFLDYERTETSLNDGMASTYISPTVTHINNFFQEKLGEVQAEPFLIHSYGKKDKQYLLKIEPDNINMIEIEQTAYF